MKPAKREIRAAQIAALAHGFEHSRKEWKAVYIADPLLAFSLSWEAENGDFRLFEDVKIDFRIFLKRAATKELLSARLDRASHLGLREIAMPLSRFTCPLWLS